MPSFDWTNGIVAIYGRVDGVSRPVGTGFVVSADGLVLTCAHVLSQAGWPYQDWDEPVQVRFKATKYFAQALVQENCFSHDTEGDYALLALREPLPQGVEPLPLWRAAAAEEHPVAMYGYLAGFAEGLRGRGTSLGVVPRDGRQILQLTSEEATHGYSGGPVWHPGWQRVIGMVKEGLTADEMGKHGKTTLALAAEELAARCPERLPLTPPVSPIVRDTAHIRVAVKNLLREYQAMVFVGRDDTLDDLDRWLATAESGRRVLTAPAGFGKTALLAHWLYRRQEQGDLVAYHFFSQRFDALRPVSNLYANLLGQLAEFGGLYDLALPDEDGRHSLLQSLIAAGSPDPGRRLIILIDALDEALNAFRPDVLSQLPPGVFLVVSARAGPAESVADLPRYLNGWVDDLAGQVRHLARLPEVSLASWLAQAGGGLLRDESQDAAFRRKLYEVSDGYPLYLRYLLDDLVQAKRTGGQPGTLLDQPARGFGEYVALQFERLAGDLGQRRAIQDFFVLLAVAHYPLLADEVSRLTDLNLFDLAALPTGLTRWLNIGQMPDGRRTYVLAHARLAGEFESALSSMAVDKRAELMTWCAAWPDHRSPYALRHHAEMLHEERRWPELIDLAFDGAYDAAQKQVLPSEPDLPLRTVRLALEAAGHEQQGEQMARLLLLLARRLLAVRRSSPVDALETVGGPAGRERACKLADKHQADARLMWYLLLAQEVAEAGQREDAAAEDDPQQAAAEILERLVAGPEARLEAPWDDAFIPVVLALLDTHPGQMLPLVERSLRGLRKSAVAWALIEKQQWAMARQIIMSSASPGSRADLLWDMAQGQAQAGDSQAAAGTFMDAMRQALAVENRRDAWFTLAGFLTPEGGLDDFDGAVELLADAVAEFVSPEGLLISRLGRALAEAQIRLGDLAGARQTMAAMGGGSGKRELLDGIVAGYLQQNDFEQALAAVKENYQGTAVRYMLQEIAAAQALAGDESIQDTVAVLLAAVAFEKDTNFWHATLVKIVSAYDDGRHLQSAPDVARSTADAALRADWLRRLALMADLHRRREEATGLLAEAAEAAGGIADPLTRSDLQRDIAVAQVEVKSFAAAADTLQQAVHSALAIEQPWPRANMLVEAAKRQAHFGAREAALITLAAAREAAVTLNTDESRRQMLENIVGKQRDFRRQIQDREAGLDEEEPGPAAGYGHLFAEAAIERPAPSLAQVIEGALAAAAGIDNVELWGTLADEIFDAVEDEQDLEQVLDAFQTLPETTLEDDCQKDDLDDASWDDGDLDDGDLDDGSWDDDLDDDLDDDDLDNDSWHDDDLDDDSLPGDLKRHMLGHAIYVLVQRQKYNRAEALIGAAEGDWLKDALRDDLARALADLDEYRQAQAIAQQIQEPELREDHLRSIAQARIRAEATLGQPDLAGARAYRETAWTLLDIAAGRRAAPDAALAILDQVREVIHGLHDALALARLRARLAEQLSDLGRSGAAAETYGQALDAAVAVAGDGGDFELLFELLDQATDTEFAQLAVSYLPPVLVACQEVDDLETRLRAAGRLAAVAHRQGNSDIHHRALELFADTAVGFDEPARGLQVAAELAESLAESGDQLLALRYLDATLVSLSRGSEEDELDNVMWWFRQALGAITRNDQDWANFPAALAIVDALGSDALRAEMLRRVTEVQLHGNALDPFVGMLFVNGPEPGDMGEAVTVPEPLDMGYDVNVPEPLDTVDANDEPLDTAEPDVLARALESAQQIRAATYRAEAFGTLLGIFEKGMGAEATLAALEACEWPYRDDRERSSVVKMAIRAGDFTAALATASQSENQDDRAQAVVDIALALAGQGDYLPLLKAALALDDSLQRPVLERIVPTLVRGDLTQAREAVGVLPEWLRDSALKEIAAAHVAAGELVAGQRVALELVDPEDRDEALLAVVEAHLEAGNPAEGEPAARKIVDTSQRCQALIAIAADLVEQDRMPTAQPLLAEAMALLTGIANGRDRAWAAQVIGLVQRRAGLKAEQAFAAADRAAAEVQPADERTGLLLQFAVERQEAGAPRAARQAIAAALKTSLVTPDATARSWALAEIAKIQAAQDDKGRLAARDTLGAAVDWARRIEVERTRTGSLETIAVAQALAGLAEAAVATAQALERPQRIWALDAVAQAQAGCGDYQAALATAGQIDEAGHRARTMQSIVTIQLAAGDVDAARRTAAAMREGANKVEALRAVETAVSPEGPPRPVEEAAAQTQAGEPYVAPGSGTAATREAQRQAETLRARAVAAAEAGAKEKAWTFFDDTLAAERVIDVEGLRRNSQAATAMALAQAGFGDQAVDLAERLRDTNGEFLPKLALILADKERVDCLNRLLPLCADQPGTAIMATPAIAKLDPERAGKIAYVVNEHTWV